MAIKTYYSTDTPANPKIYYEDSSDNVAPAVVLSSLDGSGEVVPASAAAPIPVTVSGSLVASHVIVDSGTLTTVSTVTAVTAITNALPAGSNIIGNVRIDQTTPGTTNLVAANGNVARAATDSGNPVKTGGLAQNPDSPVAAVTALQRVDTMYDLSGREVIYQGTTIDSVNDSIACLGNVAHDAVDSGNPVKVGGYANSSTPTAVTIADRVNGWFGLNGQFVAAVATGGTPGDSETAATNLNQSGAGRTQSVAGMLYDGSAWTRHRTVINAIDSTGTGIAAAGILAQYDDTSTGTVTENQFSTLRMGPNRILYTQSSGYLSAPAVTRPANTTAYTAGDVLGGVITFTNAGPSGGYVMVTGVSLNAVITAIPSGQTSWRLHLYNATPPSAIADNSPWTSPAGDLSVYLGYIDIPAMALLVAGAGFVFVQSNSVNQRFKLASGTTSLFGYLVTVGGPWTPAANSEVYTPTLLGL